MVLVFVLWAVILILTIVWIITTFQKTKHSASVCSTSGILDALSTQDMKWLHGAKLIEFGTLREKGLTHRSPKGFCWLQSEDVKKASRWLAVPEIHICIDIISWLYFIHHILTMIFIIAFARLKKTRIRHKCYMDMVLCVDWKSRDQTLPVDAGILYMDHPKNLKPFFVWVLDFQGIYNVIPLDQKRLVCLPSKLISFVWGRALCWSPIPVITILWTGPIDALLQYWHCAGIPEETLDIIRYCIYQDAHVPGSFPAQVPLICLQLCGCRCLLANHHPLQDQQYFHKAVILIVKSDASLWPWWLWGCAQSWPSACHTAMVRFGEMPRWWCWCWACLEWLQGRKDGLMTGG